MVGEDEGGEGDGMGTRSDGVMVSGCEGEGEEGKGEGTVLILGCWMNELKLVEKGGENGGREGLEVKRSS